MNPYRFGPFEVRVHNITGNSWEELGTRGIDAAREAFPPGTRLRASGSAFGPWKFPPEELNTDDVYWEPHLSVGAHDRTTAFGCVTLLDRETAVSRLMVIEHVTGNSPDEVAQKALQADRVRGVFHQDETVQVDFFPDLDTRIPEHLSTTDRYYAPSVWIGSLD
ncbi:hypothetical protein GWI34_32390 [Actinomadura sp. DSM 109109]|nr:hypothetical protein [Actinomadura lepetitiana]